MIIISEFGKMIKYGVVGIVGTIIHFGTLIILVENFAVNAIVASTAGFVLTVVVSYALNRTWTFKSKNDSKRFMKYILVSINGLLINFLIMHFGVDVMRMNYRIAQLLVIGVLPFVNYIFNRLWVFDKE